jgi:hypothetical protein
VAAFPKAPNGARLKRSAAAVRLKLPKRRWVRYAVYAGAAGAFIGVVAFTWAWVSFSNMIDDRLHGERERTLPRVYARPSEFRRNQMLSQQDLVVRLNDLGYAERVMVQQPGEFAVAKNTVSLIPRGGELTGKTIRLTFPTIAPKSKVIPRGIQRSRSRQEQGRRRQLDPPLLTALMASGAREKRRHVPLSTIRKRHAAGGARDRGSELLLARRDQSVPHDRRRDTEPVRQGRPTGGSTITQQLARMFFLQDEFNEELQTNTWSYGRKAKEAMMSLVLERRAIEGRESSSCI